MDDDRVQVVARLLAEDKENRSQDSYFDTVYQIRQLLADIRVEMDELSGQAKTIGQMLEYLTHNKTHRWSESIVDQREMKEDGAYTDGPAGDTGVTEINMRDKEGRIVLTLREHRVEATIGAAKAYVVRRGWAEFDAKDVVSELRRRGYDLGVAHPRSVISTILARHLDFTKIGPGLFRCKNAEFDPEEFPYFGHLGTP